MVKGEIDAAFHGQRYGGRRGAHSGQCLDAIQHQTRHVFGLGSVVVTATAQSGFHGDDIVGVETGLSGAQSDKGANIRHEDHGQGHLGDHQGATDAIVAESGSRTSAGFFEHGVHVELGDSQRGSSSKSTPVASAMANVNASTCQSRVEMAEAK